MKSQTQHIGNYSNVFDYSPFGAPLDGRTMENIFYQPKADTIIVTDTLFIINNNFENPVIEPNGAGVKIDGWTHYSPSTTLSVEPHNGSDWLKVVSTNGTHGAHQGFSVEPGESYTFEIDLHRPAGMNKEINIVIWKNSSPSGTFSVHVLNVDGTNTFTYNATSSDIFIQIRQAGTYYLDNIRMYRTYEDTIFVSGYEVDRAYRYGAFGHEKDNEVKGSGNHLSFGDYGYDPRSGRRWNIDPKTKKYPDLSPYATFNNNPIFFTDPDGQEPIKPSATSLSGLIKVLNSKNVKSLADLISWYGGIEPPGPMDNVKSNGWLTERYVYSKSWGWIDMRHFSAAAYGTDLLLASSDDILENGEQTEAGQEQAGYPSAWSYEDLVSNALGVYFESYLEDYDGTTLEALESFFKEIGVVENPLEAAPNELPEEERTSPPQNTTYKPKYATHKRKKGLNAKIVKFIEEFTGEDISKDRRSKVVDENGKPKGSN